MGSGLEPSVALRDGVRMPVLGLGTAGATGRECVAAVRAALRFGYRLVDTASAYGNEREVGIAVRESGVPREEVFITTKIARGEQGFASTATACERSLGRLGTDYVDLYLIHWPSPRKRLSAWKALERLLSQGKARAIGVSNYMVHHLDELLDESEVAPSVNQIELSPFLRQREVVAYCRRRRVQIEAYSPLTRGRRLNEATVRRIATKYGRSPAQILIRWSLQHGYVAIPMSVRIDRIQENADVWDFTIGPGDMRALDALDQGLHFDWDPTEAP